VTKAKTAYMKVREREETLFLAEVSYKSSVLASYHFKRLTSD
jgi:hypothetical protein